LTIFCQKKMFIYVVPVGTLTSIYVVKGKVVPVLNLISTTP
jgi:hypothetical protein